MSNYSSSSDSSLSWGEDNFEYEATRQVTVLFEQLDDLLFSDLNQFPNYPIVPLQQKAKGSNSIHHEKARAKKSPIKVSFIKNWKQKGAKNIKDLPARKKNRTQPQKLQHNDDGSCSGSDSSDEVVWETLSKPKKDISNGKKSRKLKNEIFVQKQQKQQQKSLRKKLSTISELGAHSKKSLSDEALNVSSLKLPKTVRRYSDSDGEDTAGVKQSLVDANLIGNGNQIKKLSMQMEAARRNDESSKTAKVEADGATISTASSGSNLRGGIYAMGFTAPQGVQVTSPMLLNTPATPPGVPLNPTPLMIEESSYWSSRFPYLRVTGRAIDPLKLKLLESFAFADNSTLPNGSSLGLEVQNSISEEESLTNNGEEIIAEDGHYDPDVGYLCLTGSYLPYSFPSRKASYDARSSNRQDSMQTPIPDTQQQLDNRTKNITDRSISNDPSCVNTDPSKNNGSTSKKSSLEKRQVWSGSQDPVILKEQVLLTLFDSMWPQVINVVGGLVHRYSCHLLASVAALSIPGSRETTSRGSRIDSSSTMSEMEVWRRLDSASIFSRRSSIQNSLYSASREPSALARTLPHSADQRSLLFRRSKLSTEARDFDIQEEARAGCAYDENGACLLRSASSGGRSRLSTAKALMQIQRSPLSPACSNEANVVSLPSLDIPSQRPQSSVSSLSSLSTTRLSASSRSKFSLLTLDVERGSSLSASSRSDDLSLRSPGVSFATSPHWPRPLEGLFLPPISSPGSPSIAASTSDLEASKDLSAQKRVFGGSSRPLTRRNSDTMTKIKDWHEVYSSETVNTPIKNARRSADSVHKIRKSGSKVGLHSAEVQSVVRDQSNPQHLRNQKTPTSSSLPGHGRNLKQSVINYDTKPRHITRTKHPLPAPNPRDKSYTDRRSRSQGRKKPSKGNSSGGSRSVADLTSLKDDNVQQSSAGYHKKSMLSTVRLHHIEQIPYNKTQDLRKRHETRQVQASKSAQTPTRDRNVHELKKPRSAGNRLGVEAPEAPPSTRSKLSAEKSAVFRFGDYHDPVNGAAGKGVSK